MSDAVKTVIGVSTIIAGSVTGQVWLTAIGVNLTQSGISDMSRGRKNLASRQSGFARSVTSSDAPLPVIYGIAKLAPRVMDVRVDRNSTDAKDLAWVGGICVASEDGSGIESVEKVWFNEDLAIDGPAFEAEPNVTGIQAPYTGELTYGLHAGSDAQVIDAQMDARFPEYAATAEGAGIAYIALILTLDDAVYPAGIPSVTMEVKGQKVYDPRTPAWAWSDNPALCVLDYLTSARYGVGAAYSERDGGSVSEIDEASFEAAANYFDEQVSAPSGNQNRFRCNGIISTGATHLSNLNQLLTSCRADLVYQSGKFRLVARKIESAETFELTEDNIIGDWDWGKAGAKETANRITVSYIDSVADYQVQEVVWPESDQTNNFLTNDNSWENLSALELPFTNDLYMAQQIGMVLLRESREDVTVALTAKEEALKLQVGEVVKVTHSTPAWTDKLFRVLAIGINPDATVRFVLREYDSNAYSLDTLNTKDTLVATDIPDVLTDLHPEILDFSPDYDTDGTINVWAIAEQSAANLYCNVGINSDPGNPTTSVYHGTVAGVNGVMVTAIDSEIGDFVTIRCIAANANGNIGPAVVKRFRRGDSAKFPFTIGMDQGQSATDAEFDATITDPSLAVTAVTFKTKTGAGDFAGSFLSTWDRSSGTAGTDKTLTRGEDIAFAAKHNVAIKIKVTYTDAGGVSVSPEFSWSSDSDLIAEITGCDFDIDVDGNLFWSPTGDEDTAQLIANIVKNGALVTVTQANKDATITAQKGSADTGVDMAFGDYANISVGACPSAGVAPDTTQPFFIRRATGSITKTQRVAACTGQPGAGSSIEAAGSYIHPGALGAPQSVYMPVRLPQGVVITAFRARYHRAHADDTITVGGLAKMDSSASVTNVATLTGSFTTIGSWATAAATGLSETVSASDSYYAVFTMTAVGTKTDLKILYVEVDYTSADIDKTL